MTYGLFLKCTSSRRISARPRTARACTDGLEAETTVGPGVVEIRVHTEVEHRVFYVAKFEEAVYVLHAFEKRTRKTSVSDIALAQKRFAELLQRRAQKARSRKP